jgi:glutaredoxin-like protein NrdH
MPTSITVYTKPACPQCDATKRHLTRSGTPFEAVDLSQDPGAIDTVRELGYSSAPVVVAGDVHFSGFRPDALNRLGASAPTAVTA